MYVMLIWPQQRQLKKHRALLASLKKGDEVVTQGGMIGKIVTVADKELVLEIASGVKVRLLKTSVQSLAAEPSAAAGKLEEKKEEK
jgi:preprotein translocase subunit YajC